MRNRLTTKPAMGNILLALLAAGTLLAVSFECEAEVLTSKELLERMENSSPAIQELNVQLEAAKLEHKRASIILKPEISYSNERLTTGTETERESIIGITHDVSFLWSRPSRIAAARFALEAAEADYQQRKLALQSEVIIGTLRLNLLRKEISLLDSILSRIDYLVQATQARANIGELALYQLERFRLEQSEMLDLHQDLLVCNRELTSLLIGQTGLSEEVLSGIEIRLSDIPAVNPDTLLSQILEFNPKLRMLKNRAEAAKFEVSAATTGGLPALDLGVGSKTASGGGSGVVFDLTASFDLLGQRKSAIGYAKAASRSAEMERLAYERQVEVEARGILIQLERLQSSQTTPLATVPKLSVSSLIKLYSQGEMTAFELSDILAASFSGLQAQHNLRVRRVELEYELRMLSGQSLLD